MKVFLCEKCNEILSKGKIECSKCGYVSERLYSKMQKSRTYKKVIIVLAVILAVIGFFSICNTAMLFPWQHQARNNRKAILKYARENYPGAKIVEEYYPTMKFNPTGNPYDTIWFDLDGIQFYIEARDGKIERDDDGYGVALLRKEICEKYLDNFFLQRGLSYYPEIGFMYDDSAYWPQKGASLSTFPGSIQLEFVLERENNKQTPQDFGWFYDFYCYWEEVCPTPNYALKFCLRIDKNTFCGLWCYSSSAFKDEDDFYSKFEYTS